MTLFFDLDLTNIIEHISEVRGNVMLPTYHNDIKMKSFEVKSYEASISHK